MPQNECRPCDECACLFLSRGMRDVVENYMQLCTVWNWVHGLRPQRQLADGGGRAHEAACGRAHGASSPPCYSTCSLRPPPALQSSHQPCRGVQHSNPWSPRVHSPRGVQRPWCVQLPRQRRLQRARGSVQGLGACQRGRRGRRPPPSAAACTPRSCRRPLPRSLNHEQRHRPQCFLCSRPTGVLSGPAAPGAGGHSRRDSGGAGCPPARPQPAAAVQQQGAEQAVCRPAHRCAASQLHTPRWRAAPGPRQQP